MGRLTRRKAISGRVSEEVHRELRGIARAEGRSVSEVLARLAEQGVRMRRFPGLVFIDGPGGPRAHLAGTGFDAWELVALFRAYGGDVARLLRDHPALERRELELALEYAKAYPEEIDQFIADNEAQARGLAPV